VFKTAVTLPAVFGDRPLTSGIRAAGELGIDGIEFFDWENQSLESISAACEDAGVSVAATLSAGAGANIEDPDAPAMTNPEDRDQAIADVERSIDFCETLGCQNLIVTVGPDQNGIDRSTQYDTIVEILSTVASRAEDANVTLVVEPLNVRVDHPGYFLTASSEAFSIVDDVGSPNVAVLFDVYHQQITEGDVTRRLTENVEDVGHVHIADNPGRNEPGTGELNYANVFDAIDDAGYEGYVGCEFSPTGDPDAAMADVLDMR
jgi:hydroxypyruvate isomerase